MTHSLRIPLLIIMTVLLTRSVAAQEIVLPDTPPTFDPAEMADHLYHYASGPDVRLGRDIEVHYLVTAGGILYSPFIPNGQVQVTGRSDLFNALRYFGMKPATYRGTAIESLWKTTLRFEPSAEEGRGVDVIIDGERFSSSPPDGRTPLPSSMPAPIEGTTTPPGASAPSLSMDLNMVSLSYTEIFDGTITATLVVEPDGSHGLPVRVQSSVAPSFTADVIDVLSEATITPGKVKGRPVRSLLEVTILCSGVKGVGGRTEQGIRIAQSAPVPVPEADQIAKDTVAVPTRESEMVEQETTIYQPIEAPGDPVEPNPQVLSRAIGSPTDDSAEVTMLPQEEVITTEVGASYDPDELSRLMEFPEGTAERGREEFVVLNVHVTPEGKADVIEVLAGSWDALNGPAISAVSRLRFNPATVNGHPVESSLVITLRYTP